MRGASKTSKREARRWLDELGARCTNPSGGPYLLSYRESARIDKKAFADLQKRDKALLAAVIECITDQMIAEDGISIEEWKKQGVKRRARLDNVRIELRKSGALS